MKRFNLKRTHRGQKKGNEDAEIWARDVRIQRPGNGNEDEDETHFKACGLIRMNRENKKKDEESDWHHYLPGNVENISLEDGERNRISEHRTGERKREEEKRKRKRREDEEKTKTKSRACSNYSFSRTECD